MKKIILVSALFLTFLLGNAQVVLAVPDAQTGTPAEWKEFCSNNDCCGLDTTTKGYSCMGKTEGTSCKASYCVTADSVDIQCCKPKSDAAGTVSTKSIPNPLKVTTVEGLAAQIINYALGLVGTISLLLFIYGGLIWMTSAGSSDKVKKGRDIIVWAVIGMAVVFMSYIAVKFVIQGLQGTL